MKILHMEAKLSSIITYLISPTTLAWSPSIILKSAKHPSVY